MAKVYVIIINFHMCPFPHPEYFKLTYILHEDQFFCISSSPLILCSLWESKSQEIIFRFKEFLSSLRYQPRGVFLNIRQ